MEYMTITELTKAFNVSSRMIRYYEKMGLMESSRRENYAYRVYDETAVKRLQQIIILRKLRISLKEIAVILGDNEQKEALQIMQENVCKLDDEIDALNTIKDILNVFIVRLNESVCKKIRLDFLDDTELLAMTKILKGAKTNMKEEHSIEQLNNANETIHKLQDKDVRILYIPPMTAASIHCVSEAPENDCHIQLKKFVMENRLWKTKPDFRIFGFNNDDPDCHGYEMWVTVPENLEVSEPFLKKQISGGLYGAHMIPFGAFEEWQWLYEWAATSKEYDIDWRAPENMMGGMLEEHIRNHINNFDDEAKENNGMTQLDLLIPIRRKE